MYKRSLSFGTLVKTKINLSNRRSGSYPKLEIISINFLIKTPLAPFISSKLIHSTNFIFYAYDNAN